MPTILVLDDDARFVEFVTEALASRGDRLLHASRCAQAEKLLRTQRADLLIVDGLLPDATGLSLLEKLRAAGDRTPALFVSAFWRKESPVKGLENVLFLPKPCSAERIARRVSQLLGEDSSQAAVALQLSALREAFERELPAQVEGVRAALRELVRDVRNPAVRGVLKRRAHVIAGTAGSFGFRELGDLCAHIEQALSLLDKGDAVAVPRLLAALDAISAA